MEKIAFNCRHALHSVAATRLIEQAAAADVPPHSLMRRAGLALAQLALALAPHARRIWVACGAGNNGGDGLEAAMHLQRWGKNPVVSWLGSAGKAPPDAAASFERARQAGVTFAPQTPAQWELGIDALLGIGSQPRPAEGALRDFIRQLNAGAAPVLAADVPTGLNADTGAAAIDCVQATHTLSLLTLKPGLFTAAGRDSAGCVWYDRLGVTTPDSIDLAPPCAWLSAAPVTSARLHASHKGSYGDVAVIGGAPGMTGAALLAASAALYAGAGRVYVGLLDAGGPGVDSALPELMFRHPEQLDLTAMTVVCGCGGGTAIAALLGKILSTASRLVLDADALNAIASDSQLQTLLHARAQRDRCTVLTPHPLEAARLLGESAAWVQADRLRAATQLQALFACVIALKGSGTLIAAPGQTPLINPTGNARLASAGTGDVLAGLIAAGLTNGKAAFEAAWQAVFRHGLLADQWPAQQPLTAAALAHGAVASGWSNCPQHSQRRPVL